MGRIRRPPLSSAEAFQPLPRPPTLPRLPRPRCCADRAGRPRDEGRSLLLPPLRGRAAADLDDGEGRRPPTAGPPPPPPSSSFPPSSSSSTIVVCDVENVRGAASFRLSHEALLHRAASWRRTVRSGSGSAAGAEAGAGYAAIVEGLAMVFDHGESRTAHSGGPLAEGVAAVFAGPDRTADDVIVSLVGERCGGLGYDDAAVDADDVAVVAWTEEAGSSASGAAAATHRTRNATVVVTADARLISRCQRARRASPTCSEVAFVEPASFLRELEAHASAAEEEAFFGIGARPRPLGGRRPSTSSSSSSEPADDDVDDDVDDDFGGGGGEVKGGAADSERAESAASAATSAEDGRRDEESDSADDDDDIDNDADLAFVKREDAELALLRSVELRQRLVRDINSKIGPPKRGGGKRGGGQKGGNGGGRRAGGVISARKRGQLLARRHRAQRKADMAEAFRRRQVLAERLRRKLLAAPGAKTAERVPIYRLLEWLSVPTAGGGRNGSAPSTAPLPLPLPLLTYSAGEDALPGESGPLSSVLTVPLRSNGNGAPNGDRNAPPPLRMVVISDTHGFERTLLKLPSPAAGGGDDASAPPDSLSRPDYPVLPRADVLIHCGDFASNGSRARQRESIRKLDAFLAAQSHIPEKIVVRGNHDPETPGRVLFPKSRALYATSSRTVTVNGVRFALEPFSRRRAAAPGRNHPRAGGTGGTAVPPCDVLVSHEPPRDVLDLTYSGMRAGSASLRRAVELAKTKPRCWLCGHIHEGRGAAKEAFVDNGGERGIGGAAVEAGGEGTERTTLVVNAANANHGKANRLVAGAVVVDVEREAVVVAARPTTPTGDAPAAAAAAAEQSPDEPSSSSPAATRVADLGLEPREMRPGVRRRKGLNAAWPRRAAAGRRRR